MLDRLVVAAGLIAALLGAGPAPAGEAEKCTPTPIALWGDGRHDDTNALNVWFRGDHVVWAQTGEKVGDEISGHAFKLNSAVYVRGGTGRRLVNFQMIWPTRGERVAGGMILAGADPDAAPVATGISKTGGDPGEGVPFAAPNPTPEVSNSAATSCAVS